MKSEELIAIFEEGLDLALLVTAMIYAVAISEGWAGLGENSLSIIAAAGAGLRLASRRLARRIAVAVARRSALARGPV